MQKTIVYSVGSKKQSLSLPSVRAVAARLRHLLGFPYGCLCRPSVCRRLSGEQLRCGDLRLSLSNDGTSIYLLSRKLLAIPILLVSWHGYQASKHTRTDIICHPSTFKLKNAQIITSIFIPRNNRPLAHYPFDLL